MPVFGQVQGDLAAAVAGGAGGDVDEVAAQRGSSGLGAGEAGQGPGGTQQVVADGGAGQPGGVRGERARGQVRQGPVGQVGEDLFDLGVVAVVLLGLEGGERGVGEDGVVTPGGEQFALARGGLAVEVFDPADDQPGGDRLPFFEVNAVYFTSATCASETQRRSWSSQTARG